MLTPSCRVTWEVPYIAPCYAAISFNSNTVYIVVVVVFAFSGSCYRDETSGTCNPRIAHFFADREIQATWSEVKEAGRTHSNERTKEPNEKINTIRRRGKHLENYTGICSKLGERKRGGGGETRK